MMAEIASALQGVRVRVTAATAAAGRATEPRLVAVSKLKPVEMIQAAFDAGQRHFGENYVQEITEKAPALPAELRWHFIGKLQSNKAKKLVTAVPNLACVETVDTVKLAKMLDKACAAAERAEPLRVFVQVNTTDEPQKNGTTIDGALDVALHIHKECENLAFAGLMTVGKLGEPAPIYFERLVECRSSVCAALGLDVESVELSMGMSADFEDAIAAGSTNVRVGSSIFGARDPKKVAERRAESAKADDATAGDSPSGAGGAGGAAGAATDGKE